MYAHVFVCVCISLCLVFDFVNHFTRWFTKYKNRLREINVSCLACRCLCYCCVIILVGIFIWWEIFERPRYLYSIEVFWSECNGVGKTVWGRKTLLKASVKFFTEDMKRQMEDVARDKQGIQCYNAKEAYTDGCFECHIWVFNGFLFTSFQHQ